MPIKLNKLDAASFPLIASLLPISEQRRPRLGKFAVKGLVALYGGVGVGVVLLAPTRTTLDLTYIYVSTSWRRVGVGTLLLRASLLLAQKSGLDLAISFAATDCQDPLHQFLSSLSAFAIRRQPSFLAHVEREEMQRTLGRHAQLIQPQLPGFFAQKTSMQLEFMQRLEPQWPDLISLWKYNKDNFDGAASLCTIQNQRITAVSLITWENQIPQLRFLYGEAHQSPAILRTMATSLSQLMSREFQVLSVTAATQQSRLLLKKLCGTYGITQWIYTAYSL